MDTRIRQHRLRFCAALVLLLGSPHLAANEHRNQCKAFLDSAMKPLHQDPIARLINQKYNRNSTIGDKAIALNHAEVATAVATVCEEMDIDMITSKPCWYVLNGREFDPAEWCDVASEPLPLIKAAVINHAKLVVSVVGDSNIQSVEEFQQREGWLTLEGPVTYRSSLEFSSDRMGTVNANMTDLLAAVGAAPDALWEEQKLRLDALRAEVERTADEWPIPDNEGENYSTDLVSAQVKEMHPDADIEDAYLGRSNWKIHKNALGITQRRTLPGYVLFKLGDDPYCQLRSYTLTEQHTAAGNFQPAKGVALGYVRFQQCPGWW
ncbi:MAG: hypothetical protein AAF513_08785 [Pseudomonadota bacterium]